MEKLYLFFNSDFEFKHQTQQLQLNNCTNYFKLPYELDIIDCGIDVVDTVECIQSLKIKHSIHDGCCTIAIKAAPKDAVLSLYILAAKLYIERDGDFVKTLKGTLFIRLGTEWLDIGEFTMLSLLKKLDTHAHPETIILECILKVSLIDTNHANEIISKHLYLLEGSTNLFFEELRRQSLVKAGILTPSIY